MIYMLLLDWKKSEVQDSAGESQLPTKIGIPVTETEIGSHNDGSSFVEISTKLKQQLCPFLSKRNEPSFIQDEQIIPLDRSQKLGEPQVLLRAEQVIHQACCTKEADWTLFPRRHEVSPG
jgi:hypothetical protein